MRKRATFHVALGVLCTPILSAVAQDVVTRPAGPPQALTNAASGNWVFGTNVLFDTGPPRTVLFNGASTWLGWSSGNVNANQPQRWTAQPFTLEPGEWTITGIDHDYFWSGTPGTDIGIRIWTRNGEDAPTENDEVFIGSAPAVPLITNPRTGAGTWFSRLRDLSIGPLSGGDYYLSLYGINSGGGLVNAAWLTNAGDGIPKIHTNGRPYMWRSATYPSPGMEFYQLDLSVLAPNPGEDPDHLYNAAFTLRGEEGGGCTRDPCDMNCDDDINALDIEFFIGLLFDGDEPCCGNRGDIGSSGDVNRDGRIDAADIEGFINCLFP